MNQSLLFNDDLEFDDERHAWSFSCLIEGNLHKVVIDEQYHSRVLPVTEQIKFEWEERVENWLKNYEPVGIEIVLELNN